MNFSKKGILISFERNKETNLKRMEKMRENISGNAENVGENVDIDVNMENAGENVHEYGSVEFRKLASAYL